MLQKVDKAVCDVGRFVVSKLLGDSGRSSVAVRQAKHTTFTDETGYGGIVS